MKPSWFVDQRKESDIRNVNEADVKSDLLPNVLMGPLWLLVGYVLKRAGAHLVHPINEERLIVLYGRGEAGLIKNLQADSRLYDPIVVKDADFTAWVVEQRDAIIFTIAEWEEEKKSLPSLSDILSADDIEDGMEMTCYVTGRNYDDGMLCYFGGEPSRGRRPRVVDFCEDQELDPDTAKFLEEMKNPFSEPTSDASPKQLPAKGSDVLPESPEKDKKE